VTAIVMAIVVVAVPLVGKLASGFIDMRNAEA
jgi:hypothetical protein